MKISVGRWASKLFRAHLVTGAILGIASIGLAGATPPPWAVPPLPTVPLSPITLPTTDGTLLSKASPDECFAGIGVDYPALPCVAPAKPKVNQAYLWGLTKSGDKLWFGTMANTACLIGGGYMGMTTPSMTDAMVCEYGSSQAARLGVLGPPQLAPGQLPAAIGDYRPPHIYAYDITTNTIVEKSVGPALAALNSTLGLRSAGSMGSVVFLAGPSMSGGLNMFAFANGTFVGYKNFPAYSNVRKFAVIQGVLYVGVGGPTAALGEKTGRVLRWSGDLTSPPTFPNLFNFVEVGSTDSMVSEIAEHDGRIFATTWPDVESPGAAPKIAGLFMSSPIPDGGLVGPTTDWAKVWAATEYEPDPVTAATYGGGALTSFGGYLYWGTMHTTFMSTFAHLRAYPGSAPTSLVSDIGWFLGSERASTIFRGKDFATTPTREILYGYSEMPVCLPTSATTCKWQLAPNKMGQQPVWGPAGFGNPYNAYTWTMAVYDNRLWVGMGDSTAGVSDLLASMIGGAVTMPPMPPLPQNLSLRGADLWYFPNAKSPAFPENISGLGNTESYGIRNMLATDTDLYLGMANPENLLTDPAAGPLGGWELIDLKAKQPNTATGTNVKVELGGGNWVQFCKVNVAGITKGNAIYSDYLPDISEQMTGLRLSQLFMLGSTSDWQDPTCTDGLAQVFVTQPGLPANSHLLELTWDGTQGRMVWKDITVSQSAEGLVGKIDAQFRGVLAVTTSASITPMWQVTKVLVPSDAGVVTCTPNPVPDGSPVVCTATARSGFAVTRFSDNCTALGSTSCQIDRVVGPTIVTVSFEKVQSQFGTLTVGKLGDGGGVVTSLPTGISCGTTCASEILLGTEVTLTATPFAGSEFGGWTGGLCAGNDPVCKVTFGATGQVTAAFRYTGTQNSLNLAQELYVAYYGRPGDPEGRAFWAGQGDLAGSFNAVVNAFGASAEFLRRYAGFDDQGMLTKIYQQTLQRDPDNSGMSYYLGELGAGRQTFASVAMAVLAGAFNDPDSTVVANKVEVANYFTGKVAAGCPYVTEQFGVDLLSLINANSSTVTAAKSIIDNRCGT